MRIQIPAVLLTTSLVIRHPLTSETGIVAHVWRDPENGRTVAEVHTADGDGTVNLADDEPVDLLGLTFEIDPSEILFFTDATVGPTA